jgi:4-hydroxybenzoate polyprenyltransferase
MERLQYPPELEVPAAERAIVAGQSSLRWLRITLTAAVVVGLVLMAILDARPLVMLVGLAPLILIAGEALWHILAGLERSGD